MKRVTLLSSLLMAIAFSMNAQASLMQFNFVSTVIYTDGSLSGVGVGTVFTGSFSYDPTTAQGIPYPGNAYYDLGPTSSITAKIGGHLVSANRLNASITDNFGGNVEDGVTIYGGYPLSVGGAVYSSGSFGINLHSQPGNTDVLTSTALPTSYDVSEFDSAPFNYGWLQRDGGQRGTIAQFSVNSITAVPEPETYALVLGGLVGMAMRRRKVAKGFSR